MYEIWGSHQRLSLLLLRWRTQETLCGQRLQLKGSNTLGSMWNDTFQQLRQACVYLVYVHSLEWSLQDLEIVDVFMFQLCIKLDFLQQYAPWKQHIHEVTVSGTWDEERQCCCLWLDVWNMVWQLEWVFRKEGFQMWRADLESYHSKTIFTEQNKELIHNFITWCNGNHLKLSTTKIKALVIERRAGSSCVVPKSQIAFMFNQESWFWQNIIMCFTHLQS